jgi:site-specific recombinase XerD
LHFLSRQAPPEGHGEDEIQQFLTYLATERNVTPSTQNQARNALNFLYRHVLDQELSGINFVRAKKASKLPVVLTSDEVIAVINNLDGVYWLMGNLMYGAGLRLMECLKLRVKDLGFNHRAILVRDGNGAKDCEIMGLK